MSEIINTHDQLVSAKAAGLPDVGILTSSCPGRGPVSQSGWKVYRPGFQTDPKAAWYDYGCKVFHIIGQAGTSRSERKAAALKEAQQWAGKRYGITEWKRNRLGDYVDARVNKAFPLRKATA